MFSYKYPRPALTADCIVFAVSDNGRQEKELNVLLIQRGNEPYKGRWAFPGGFMNMDETTAEAARRELKEETGLVVGDVRQVGVFDQVDRDPRGRVITVAYYAFMTDTPEVKGGDDAARAEWFSVSALPPLAFDHDEILKKALSLYNNNINRVPLYDINF